MDPVRRKLVGEEDDIVLLMFQIPLENMVFGKGQLVSDFGISW
jgi:hypothetical protein